MSAGYQYPFMTMFPQATEQLAPEQILVDFKNEIRHPKNELSTEYGLTFCHLANIQHWINTSERFYELVKATYHGKPCHDKVIQSKLWDEDLQHFPFLRVLCTLIDIDAANSGIHLDNFMKSGGGGVPDDTRMPILKDKLAKIFGSCGCRDLELLVNKFYDAQFRYCPVTIIQDMYGDYRLEPMPIVKFEKGGEGAQGTVRRAYVPSFAVHKDLRPIIREVDGFSVFAVKTYPNSSREQFERERGAYITLNNAAQSGRDSCIVKYIGSYEQIQSEDGVEVKTLNLLFECAEGDLGLIFSQDNWLFPPPSSASEVEEFWISLLHLIEALSCIHNLKTRHENDAVKGLHQDIKPENVLVFGNQFKLADMGLALFIEGKAGKGSYFTSDGRSRTCGSPESFKHDQQSRSPQVKRQSDVWSLGCVLSMAATWAIFDLRGVMQYEEVRKAAAAKTEASSDGDCFHDGSHVLDEIQQWHKYIRDNVRIHDRLTNEVLDLVDKMFLPFEERPSSEVLWKEAQAKISHWKRNSLALAPGPLQQNLRRLSQSRRSKVFSMYMGNVAPGSKNEAANAYVGLGQRANVIRNYEAAGRRLVPNAPFNTPASPPTNPSDTPTIKPPFHRGSTDDNLFYLSDPPSSPSTHTVGLPYMSVDAAYEHANRNKNVFQQLAGLISHKKHTKKKGSDKILSQLKGRDIVFYVDNRRIMAKYWMTVKKIVIGLSHYARPYDKDGMELKFFTDNTTVKEKNVGDFRHALDGNDAGGMSSGDPILTSLDDILTKYAAKYRQTLLPYHPELPPCTLYVLTSGEALPFQTFFREPIRRCLETVPKERIGIQFIYFDEKYHYEFKSLDDHLTDEQGGKLPDIVDCTHSSGNIFKMLLGGVNPDIDQGTDDEASDYGDYTHHRVGSQGSVQTRSSIVQTMSNMSMAG